MRGLTRRGITLVAMLLALLALLGACTGSGGELSDRLDVVEAQVSVIDIDVGTHTKLFELTQEKFLVLDNYAASVNDTRHPVNRHSFLTFARRVVVPTNCNVLRPLAVTAM